MVVNFTEIRELPDRYIAFDNLLGIEKKLRKSSDLNVAKLLHLPAHLLVTYECFGREYLCNV